MISLSCKLALAGSSRGVAAALSQFRFQTQHAVAGQHSIQPPPALATGPTRLNSPALDLCRHLSQQHDSLAAQLFLPLSTGETLVRCQTCYSTYSIVLQQHGNVTQ